MEYLSQILHKCVLCLESPKKETIDVTSKFIHLNVHFVYNVMLHQCLNISYKLNEFAVRLKLLSGLIIVYYLM